MAYQQLTRAQLRTRLEARVESVPFWTTPEANDAINEALQFWGLLTGRWKRREILTSTANTYELALPGALTYRMRVTFNGLPMSPTSRAELNDGRYRWRQETSADGGDVPNRPMLWAPVSLSLIYIWPMDAYGHNSFLLDGVSATPVLVTDGQYVDLGEEDVNVLLGYALHTLTFKLGGPRFAATMDLFKATLAAAAAENALITTSQMYRQVMGLDRRDLKPFRVATASVADLAASAAGAGGDDDGS